MLQRNDPKNKGTNKENEPNGDQIKTIVKKENNREEQDTVPVDSDAQKYFNAQDEDQELRTDDDKNIPL
jgi:hypothetical protein